MSNDSTQAPYPSTPYNEPSSNVGVDANSGIAAIVHIGGVFFSWLVPLVIFLVYPPDKSRFVNEHAKEALNFQITLFIGYVISGILAIILVGLVLAAALWLFAIIVGIQATLAASRGESYRYPMTLRLIK